MIADTFPEDKHGVKAGVTDEEKMSKIYYQLHNFKKIFTNLVFDNKIKCEEVFMKVTCNDTDLYNKSGEKMQLKTGMLCETKIIVEQKSVLRYLLEKIELMD